MVIFFYSCLLIRSAHDYQQTQTISTSVMHQPDILLTQPLRHLRATVGTTLVVLALPALLMLAGILSVRGTAIEASEAQGFAVISVAVLFSAIFTAIVFPAVARNLHSRNKLSRSRFYRAVFFLLAIVSFLFCAAWALAVERDWGFLFMAPGLFVVASLVVLPFRPLWLRLAQ